MEKVTNLKSQYNNYIKSKYNFLWEKYSKPSYSKIEAWRYCETMCNNYNGHDLKLIGGNTFIFSAGFMFEENGKKCFAYITPSHDKYMEVE